MARPLNEQEYAAKRNKILDSALRLIYTKGFERMTIQDLLAELGISKGAFFHYFASKNDLLEALIERMTGEIIHELDGIIEDPSLNARQKMERYFQSALRWKTSRKEVMIALLRVWYLDENAVVRQKALFQGIQQITPILAKIIEQGNREGLWSVTHAEETAKMMIYLFQGFSDSLAQQLLSAHPQLNQQWLNTTLEAYTEAIERLLGAERRSLALLNREDIASWFPPTTEIVIPTSSNRKEFTP